MTAGRPPSKAKKLKSYAKRECLPGRVNIDWDLVEKWVMAGATGFQIAAALGIHSQTLYDRAQKDHRLTWTEYAREKTEKGNKLIHQKQFDKAMNGSDRMLIWLGKQRLGQTDKIESKFTGIQEITQRTILELPDNGNRFTDQEVMSSSGTTD